jgi:ATP-dependent exoDNAse (exonuclease V) beta subunit
LLGTKDYNGQYDINKFYRCLHATSDEMRIPTLVQEIKRIQKRIEYEEQHGAKLTPKEKSIAILVRENWQADMIRTECGRLGISVHTNTGGDLYMSQPAIDMLTLVNALVHFDEADYLYNLVSSNFFNLEIPKSNLFEKRMKMRASGWRAKTDEKEQVNYLIHFMNIMLANTVDKNNKWEYIVASLRTQPVLQAIRKVYSTLEPWKNFSDDPWKQHYYQLNVDLLFEQLINACNVDRLTINTLQEHLHNSIVSQVSVDSRTPSMDERDLAIQCITVHKSKGLEYGHVIMPFCSASISYIKKTQLHVSTVKKGNRYQIGYSMSVGSTGETVRNDYYDESVEQSEKTREEARVLYVAMTRAIRSFSWIAIEGKQNLSWQNLIETEV